MYVYLTDARRFGVSLLFATGSKKHLERLQQRAADRGMTLSPEGLRRGQDHRGGNRSRDLRSARAAIHRTGATRRPG
jgi:DNA polymerase/3'-5' exonuclease PolX